MHHLFIEPIVNSGLVRAFCWTLIHSCWQGLVLAVLTGLIVLLTRRSRPVVRYYLFSGLFLLFFFTVCATFAHEIGAEPVTVVNITEPSVVQVVHIGTQAAVVPAAGVKSSQLDVVVAFFNRNAALIVGIWMFIFCAKLVRFGSNIITVNRIRNYKVNVPAGDWGYRVQGMAAKLGIRRSVRLMESPLIAAPMTAGLLKPVILAPLGLLANLPPSQVEAILLHELAHIQRKDYFINLLQTFLETLFFFNPAVYWLSSLIRDERESCCDDIAIGQSKSKKEFVHALVSFHEFVGVGNVMAFPGRGGNQLLNRVRRIVGRDDKRLGSGEKGFLLVCVLVAGGLMMAFTRLDREPAASAKPIGANEVVLDAGHTLILTDTVPKTNGKGSQLTRDTVDRQSEAMVKLLKEQRDLGEEEARLRVQQQLLRKRRAELEENARKAGLRPGKGDKYFEGRMVADTANATSVIVEDHELMDVKEDINDESMSISQSSGGARELKLQHEKEGLLLLKAKLKEEGKDKMRELVDPIIDMIFDRKMATDREHFRFELDTKGFVVNGVRQPEEVFDYLKVKYLVDDRNEIKYARNGKETSIAVSQVK